MDAVRGALLLIILIIVVVFTVIQGQELIGKNPYEKYVLPASVAIAFEEHQDGHSISYQGRDGYTVLQLLQRATDVQTFETNADWIYSINDFAVGPGGNWTYTINGEQFAAPPGQIRTSSGDSIVWTFGPVSP